jgi:hypothetical protein
MEKKPEFGICPIITKPLMAPPRTDGVIGLPGGQSASVVDVTVFSVPCMGENCQLWDSYNKVCSLKSSPFLQYAIESISSGMPGPFGADGLFDSGLERLLTKIVDVFELFKEIAEDRGAQKRRERGMSGD